MILLRTGLRLVYFTWSYFALKYLLHKPIMHAYMTSRFMLIRSLLLLLKKVYFWSPIWSLFSTYCIVSTRHLTVMFLKKPTTANVSDANRMPSQTNEFLNWTVGASLVISPDIVDACLGKVFIDCFVYKKTLILLTDVSNANQYKGTENDSTNI